VKDDLVQGHCVRWRALPHRPSIPLFRPAAHHAEDIATY
jgi:hypothetical protein